MNSKQFLQIGGVILLLLGILGFVLPQPLGSDILWLTPGENWAHLVLGVVALGAAKVLAADLQKTLTIIVGVVALGFTVIGFLVSGVPPLNFYGLANLEMLDNVVHLVVGVWALYAALGGKAATMPV